MKYTLLDLTQTVLSSTDGDEVNSITDTVESQQVVAIIKTVYNDIISRGNLTSNKILFNLVASNDIDKPVLMTKPNNVTNIEWIKYNTIQQSETDAVWSRMTYLSIQDFVDFSQQMNPSAADTGSMEYTVEGFTTTFNYKNNTAPNFYTTIDDVVLIFDAYDNTVDTTLQAIKTLGYGTKNLVFIEADSFVPELQADQFSLLLNEAKSLAWAELRQVPHPKAESSARKNWTHLAKSRQNVPTPNLSNRAGAFDKLPHFGRR